MEFLHVTLFLSLAAAVLYVFAYFFALIEPIVTTIAYYLSYILLFGAAIYFVYNMWLMWSGGAGDEIIGVE